MTSSAVQVIHILPRVPPAACGVADYALALARKLRREEGIESLFLGVYHDDALPDAAKTEFPFEVLSQTTSSALLTALDRHHESTTCLLLHFSPYGFQKRGVALWLARVWAVLARKPLPMRRVIMFHEVAASSSPRHSAFWLRPFQHLVARRLFIYSDSVLTNCEFNRCELLRATRQPRASVPVLPVFSNFGEPGMTRLSSKRSLQIVLFTSNLSAQHGYHALWQELEIAASHVGACRVVLVGKSASPPSNFKIPVLHTGFLKADQVSLLLAESAFGFVFVGPNLFAKSGVFAAFAAHGVIPLVPISTSSLLDDLRAGVHYARAGILSDLASPDALQHSLLQWYERHSLSATTHFFVKLIRGTSSSGAND